MVESPGQNGQAVEAGPGLALLRPLTVWYVVGRVDGCAFLLLIPFLRFSIDAQYLAATVGSSAGLIHTSNDSGASWVEQTGIGSTGIGWRGGVVSSADGTVTRRPPSFLLHFPLPLSGCPCNICTSCRLIATECQDERVCARGILFHSFHSITHRGSSLFRSM